MPDVLWTAFWINLFRICLSIFSQPRSSSDKYLGKEILLWEKLQYLIDRDLYHYESQSSLSLFRKLMLTWMKLCYLTQLNEDMQIY